MTHLRLEQREVGISALQRATGRALGGTWCWAQCPFAATRRSPDSRRGIGTREEDAESTLTGQLHATIERMLDRRAPMPDSQIQFRDNTNFREHSGAPASNW